MTNLSSRARVAQTLRAEAKLVRGGAYFVKRGVVQWASFPFGKYPRAIGIMLSDMDVIGGQDGTKGGTVTLEVGAVMPNPGAEPEIDDGLLDELMADAEAVVTGLLMAGRDTTDPVVLLLPDDGVVAREWHDIDLRVQGVIVTFAVGY